METNYFLNNSKFRDWYLPLILGVIFVILGVIIFKMPVQFFITLSILFSITFLTSGILEIAYTISNRRRLDNWGSSLNFLDFDSEAPEWISNENEKICK